MYRPSEHADEPAEDQLEPTLRLLRRKIGDRRLVADEQRQLRDELDHESSIRNQGVPKGLAPERQVGLAHREKAPDEALKRLRERRIRDIAFVLIELPRSEEAAWRHQHLAELIDNGRFPHAGVAGNEYQLGSAACADAIERVKQSLEFMLAAVQLLGNQHAFGRVMLSERKLLDAALDVPCRQAAPKVALETGGGLIAVFPRLGERPHANGPDRRPSFLHLPHATHHP